MKLSLRDIITSRIRIYLYLFSFSSVFFLQTYCTNICQFIDGLQPAQVYRNLGFIFVLHIIYREVLYTIFKTPKKEISLPRHGYYLSMISWVLAGISALILHANLYPGFPMGSHIKLLSSYVILGAGVIAQIEYIIFERSYKNKVKKHEYVEFNERLSKRILETFLIFTIAPILTLFLIVGRYGLEGVISAHVSTEILYMGSIMLGAAIILALKFRNMLKEDTKIIIENLNHVQNLDYQNIKTINRPDELGEISHSIKTMSHAIDKSAKEIAALNEEIITTQKEIIYTMGEIAESRSQETGNHVKRVAEYSKILAIAYGIPQEEAEILKLASPMHDIGKVGIPDEVLNKPGKLTLEEFKVMQTHAELGFNMLKHSNKRILQAAAIVAHEHHEKWDGSGYPNALKGEDIHIYGRITAVADVFDALGSDRCYKKKWEDEKIWELLRQGSGTHFDPKLIDLFFENLDMILDFRDKHQD